MSAIPIPDPRAEAARLVEQLEAVVPSLAPEALLQLRPAVSRIGEAIVSRALSAALEAGRRATPPEPARYLTLEEAAERVGKSKSWLYHNRKRLGMGFKVGGSLRFQAADVERFLRVRSLHRS